MGVRLTCGLARELEAERGCKEISDWGYREHKLQEWCELSLSGVLGWRGHGAEVPRLGSELQCYSEVGIPWGES